MNFVAKHSFPSAGVVRNASAVDESAAKGKCELMKNGGTHEPEIGDRVLLASKEWHPCFDGILEMLLLIDSEFVVLRANKAAADALGRNVGEIAGQPCFRLVHGMEMPPDYCPHLRAMTSGGPQVAEIDEPHLGRTLSISAFPVKDNQGRVVSTVEVIKDVSLQIEGEQAAVRLTDALAKSFSGIIEAISGLAERRDPYTAGHSKGVAELASAIARQMGLEENDIRGIEACAILHDIGKITISSGILNKSGSLSENEWGIIKMHPRTAYDALCRIDFPWPVAEVVYQHQERMDGSGYPRGLKGDEIHPWARIVAVADVVDAMSTHRPYRPALSKIVVVNELKQGREKLYDGQVVDIAFDLLTKRDRRVLVVDDEPAILDLIIEILQLMSPDLELHGFDDPVKALEAFKKKPYPLVITDVDMPEVDGFALLRRVREIHQATKVIIITGLGEKRHTLEALRLGAADFLEKPLDMEALKLSVETMLSRYEEEQ
jgi:putative nucleotidyltransferase with HDIG domain